MPGQREIELIVNHRLEHWHIKKGRGIIQGNWPQKKESFFYQNRHGSMLNGITGLNLKHPAGAEACFGDLMEWDEASADIRAADTSNMLGNFCCIIPVNMERNTRSIKKKVPAQKEIWVRFYVKISRGILNRVNQGEIFKFHYTFDEMQSFRISNIRLQKKNDSLKFAFLYYYPGELIKGSADTVYSRIPVESDVKYGIIYHLNLEKRFCQWWIDGHDQGVIKNDFPGRHGAVQFIWFGYKDNIKRNRNFNGKLLIDEVTVSDSMLSLFPAAPCSISLDQRICSLGFEFTDTVKSPHYLVQWQIARHNSWLLPVYESGAEPFTQKKLLPSFEPMKGGQSYLCRARLCSSQETWGFWSGPFTFTLPKECVKDDSNEELPVIKKLFFSKTGETNILKKVSIGKWVKLNVRFSQAGRWSDISFAIIWISRSENNIGNFNNRGGPFKKSENYAINLSIGTENIFIKNIENSQYSAEAINRIKDYIDGTNLEIDSIKRAVTVPFKFFNEALPGPWVLNGVLINNDGIPSQAVKSAVFLEKQAAISKKRSVGISKWKSGIFLFVIFIIISSLLYFTLRRNKSLKSNIFNSQGNQQNSYGPVVAQAVQIINNSYSNHELSSSWVAEKLIINSSYFGTLFKKEIGEPFTKHLNKVRLQEVKKRLRETNLQVSQICYECGFGNAEYFHRIFKKMESMTPAEYRKKTR
ncbi:MAG: helix-turn-helix domain-containing protein [bacterium]